MGQQRERWPRANAGPARPEPAAGHGRNERPSPSTDLAGALREVFAELAVQPPAGRPALADRRQAAALAEAAIAGARRARQRRTAGVGAAAVLIGAVGTVAVIHPPVSVVARRAPPPATVVDAAPLPPSLTARPAPADGDTNGASAQPPGVRPGELPIDLVASGRLLTTSGKTLDVSKVGAVHQASRVDVGWLVVGGATGSTARSLWHVLPSGRQETLVPQASALVLAADGERAAWRDGDELVVAKIAGGRLTEPRRTAAPASAFPVGLVGEGALLARTGKDGRVEAYDVWWPSRGAFVPGWVAGLATVYGALPDERTLVAARERPAWAMRVPRDAELDGGLATARGGSCLVLLDASAAFSQRTSVCGLGLATGRAGRVSPDGRWLLAQSVGGDAVLVDLAEAAHGRGGLLRAGPGPVNEPVWLDAQTVLYGPTAGTLVRLRVPAAGAEATAVTLALPELPAAPQALVVPNGEG